MDDRTHPTEDPTPDPTHDAWSAWLPDLDPPPSTPRTPSTPAAATTPLPQASAPPAVPTPPTPFTVPPPVPAPGPSPASSPLPYAGSPGSSVPVAAAYGWVEPPSRLGWAIVCTIFCFIPFGILAILQSVQVNTRLAAGDWEGARRASRSAKNWCLVAAAVWPGGFFLVSCTAMLAGGSVSIHL